MAEVEQQREKRRRPRPALGSAFGGTVEFGRPPEMRLPQIDFPKLVKERAKEISIRVTETSKAILEKAGPALKERHNRFMLAVKDVRAVPMAFVDAWGIILTAGDVKKSSIEPGEVQAKYLVSFRDTFRYQLNLEKAYQRNLVAGLPKKQAKKVATDYAWSLIAGNVRKAIEADAQAEAVSDTHPGVVFVNETLAKNPEALMRAVAQAIQREQAITVAPTDEANATELEAAVVKAMEDLGMDVPRRCGVIPHDAITPYFYLNVCQNIGAVYKEQADYINGLFSQGFRTLRKFADEFRDTLIELHRTRGITQRDKALFVKELLVAVGTPKEDVAQLFRDISMVKREGTTNADPAPLLRTIVKTTAALEMVSPRLAREFAGMVADITGADEAAVERFIEALAQQGVQTAELDLSFFSVAARGARRTLKPWMDPFTMILGLPNPVTETGDFLQHCAERVKDYFWLWSFATIHSFAISAATPIEFHAIDSVLKKLIWVQLLPAMFPRLQNISISYKTFEDLGVIAPGIVGKSLRLLGGLWSWVEGLGVGFEPTRWSRKRLREAQEFQLQSGGSTYVTIGKHTLFTPTPGDTHTNAAEFHDVITTFPTLVTGDVEHKFAVDTIKVGSDIPETYFHVSVPLPYVTEFFDVLLRPLNTFYAKFSYVKYPWKLGPHGTVVARGGKAKWAHNTMCGLIELACSFIPQARVYKRMDATGVETTQTLVSEKPHYREYERRTLGNHILANLLDYWSSLTGVFMNLTMFSYFPITREWYQKTLEMASTAPWYAQILAVGFPHVYSEAGRALLSPDVLAMHTATYAALQGFLHTGSEKVHDFLATLAPKEGQPNQMIRQAGEAGQTLQSHQNLLTRTDFGEGSGVWEALQEKGLTGPDGWRDPQLEEVYYQQTSGGASDLMATHAVSGTITVQPGFLKGQ